MVACDSSPKAFSYIRFSTPEQLKGDSLRRQLQSSKEYADSHGLMLDESLSMKDLGISAYHGENRTKGALGKFLELVDTGKIPKGSTLIVESLDRISREQVFDAHTVFTEIINRGIRIVTLVDGMEYSREILKGNWTPLIVSLSIMARAHDESEIKSKRGQAAWETKRKNSHARKLTGRCPAWLKLSKDRKRFDIVPERVELIRRIFKLYLSGNGADKINRLFNAKRISAWVSKVGWHKSYIQKILHNRAVIGEYQPHKLNKPDGFPKRVPVGTALPNYYPAIIEKDDFYRVQEMLSANVGKGGKNGAVNNLFGHVAKCGYCGSSMRFQNKGKGAFYLKCYAAERGLGCQTAPWKYGEFEKIFLNMCGQLSLAALMPAEDRRTDEIEKLRAKLHSIKGKLAATRKAKANFDKMVATADDDEEFTHARNLLKGAITQEKDLEAQHETVSADLVRAEKLAHTTAQHLESVKQLIKYMAGTEGAERAKIRSKLKMEIRQTVKRIDVFPEGSQDRVLQWDFSSDFPKIEYIVASEHKPQFVEEIGIDGDIFKNQREYNAALVKANAAKDEFDKYVKDHTGIEHRCLGIHFAAGGFREVVMRDGGYEIGTSYRDKAEVEKLWSEIVAQSKKQANVESSKISESELLELIKNYTKKYVRRFRDKYGYLVEYEEVRGEILVTALQAMKKYSEGEKHTAKMKTYLVAAFKNRMENYRKRVLEKHSHVVAADIS